AAAISAGGAPKVGLPIRAIDRTFGFRRAANGGTVFAPAAGATGGGGRGANCGGRETGACEILACDIGEGADPAAGVIRART
ncbi:MAG: hypothetical protein ACKVH1_18690, partial [Alphaproteobacteria bacterium]